MFGVLIFDHCVSNYMNEQRWIKRTYLKAIIQGEKKLHCLKPYCITKITNYTLALQLILHLYETLILRHEPNMAQHHWKRKLFLRDSETILAMSLQLCIFR